MNMSKLAEGIQPGLPGQMARAVRAGADAGDPIRTVSEFTSRFKGAPDDWGRVGLGVGLGAAGGLTLAGIIGLAHEVSLARRQRKMLKLPSETDEDTIVLTLPQKHAEVLTRFAALLDIPERVRDGAEKAATVSGVPAQEPVRVADRAPARTSHTRVPVKSVRKANCGGHQMKVAMTPYAPEPVKTAQLFDSFLGRATPSFKTYVLAGAGIPVGAGVAYALANRLHQQLIAARLKRQEEEARQELLDAMGTGKVAGWLDDLLPFCKAAEPAPAPAAAPASVGQRVLRSLMPPPRGPSEAVERGRNMVFGPMGILALLGTGGVAWLTKRILDAKAEERDRAGWNPPKVKRIVFRSQPVTDPALLGPDEEPVSEDELSAVKAAYAVLADKLSGNPRLLYVPAVKAALADIGLTPEQGYELVEQECVVKSAQPVPAFLIAGALGKLLPSAPESATPEMANAFSSAVLGHPSTSKVLNQAAANQFPYLRSVQWQDAGAAPNYPLQSAALSDAAKGLRERVMSPKLQGWYTQQYAKADPIRRVLLSKVTPDNLNTVLKAYPQLTDQLQTMVDKEMPAKQPGFSVNLKPIMQAAWPLLAGGAATWAARRAGARGPMSYLPLIAGLGGTAYNTRDQWRGPAYKTWRGAQAMFGKQSEDGALDKLLALTGGTPDQTQQQPVAVEPTPEEAKRRARRVSVQANDPAAAEYVQANRRRIGRLLLSLIEQGKVQPV